MPGLTRRLQRMSGEGALEVYARARALERAGRDIIHLELGEPDFHPSPLVVEAARRALAEGRDRYCPPAGLPPLRAALAEYLGATRALPAAEANLIVTPGCKLALYLALQATVEAGDEVLYPEASFPIYPSLVRSLDAQGAAYTLAPELGFQPDLDALAARIGPRTRVLIVCSPNNPTGTVLSRAALERLAGLALRHDLWVVSDEIYARIVYPGAGFTSIAALPGMAERTIVVDGFSKTWAMTGWRLGFLAAPVEMARAVETLVMNTFTCAAEFTQWAALEALRDADGHVARMLAEYARRRQDFVAALNRIPGWSCHPPQGAFYAWPRVPGDAAALAARLLETAGVAAIPGAAFGPSGASYLRFSFAGSGAQLAEAARRLAATMEPALGD